MKYDIIFELPLMGPEHHINGLISAVMLFRKYEKKRFYNAVILLLVDSVLFFLVIYKTKFAGKAHNYIFEN